MCQFIVGDFDAGAGGVLCNHRIHDIRRQFLVRFHGDRKVAVTATGLNIKTAYFIRDDRLFLILGDNVFE